MSEKEVATQNLPSDIESPRSGDSGNTSLEALDPETLPPSRVAETFKGKCVLVTGATGFLGKVLVEKLLRSCPGIKELFVLIRPCQKGSVEERLEIYRQNIIFNRLRAEQPDALNKLRVVSGDITAENAGLCGWQLRKIITEVNFVFHCAANVRFDGEARDILNVNLVGVQNILDVCKACKQLQALVHVSTAFSFCNYKIITEHIYPELVKPEHIIDSTKWMTDDQLLATCVYYMQERPTVYHFSKALAETLLVDSNDGVPVIIVRPSIVTASMNEPYAGWIDNYNGPSGFINVCGKGIVKTLLVEPTANADWVPVDIVANTLIVSAHYIATRSKSSSDTISLNSSRNVPIINCTCPSKNLITWVKIIKICLPFLIKYPSMEVYGRPGGTVTSSPFLYKTCRLFHHYLPALLADVVACLMWQKPGVIRLYNRIHGVMRHLEYFTTRPFKFRYENMGKLMEQMEPEDREMFLIDQSVLNWNKYMENYVLGVRRYFLREKDDTLPQARKRMMRAHYFWLILKLAPLFGVLVLTRSLFRHKILRAEMIPTIPLLGFT